MDFGELFGISSDDADFETPETKKDALPKKTVDEPKKTSYAEIMRSSGNAQSTGDDDDDEDGEENGEDNGDDDEEEDDDDDDQSHLLEEMVEELESKEKKKQSKKYSSQLPVLLLSRLLPV